MIEIILDLTNRLTMNNIEIINNCATKIEETGLKRHLAEDMPELNDVHHYVIEINYKKSEEDELIESIPDSFEVCSDNEDSSGNCFATYMFYLENQTEEDVEKIVNWLKTDKHWKSYED